MACNLSSIFRCLIGIFCILTASCVATSEQTAPPPTPTQTESPVARIYAVDAPEINSVEVLDVEAQGRVVLGQNKVGNSVYLSAYKDKVVLINYWTSRCTTCWQHIVDLYRIYGEYKQRGLIVVNVNYGETVQTASDYLVTRDPKRATIQLSDHSGQASEAQGVFSVPAAILYASNRTVVARYGNDFAVERILQDLKNLLR